MWEEGANFFFFLVQIRAFAPGRKIFFFVKKIFS